MEKNSDDRYGFGVNKRLTPEIAKTIIHLSSVLGVLYIGYSVVTTGQDIWNAILVCAIMPAVATLFIGFILSFVYLIASAAVSVFDSICKIENVFLRYVTLVAVFVAVWIVILYVMSFYITGYGEYVFHNLF